MNLQENLKSIGKNASLRFGGIIAQNLFFLLTALLITRVFSSATLGRYVLAITVFNILGLAATLGLKYGTLRYVAFYRGREDEGRLRGTIISSAAIALAGGVILGGALFAVSPRLAETVFHAPGLKVPFRILACCLPLLALSTVLISSLQGFKAIREKVYLENFIQPLSTLLLTAAVFAIGLHLTAALASWALAVAAVCLLAAWRLRRIYPPLLSGPRPLYEIKSLLAFSFPLMGVGFLYYLFTRMDILMLGYFRPSAEVGIYSIAARLSLLIALPLNAVNVIFEPTVAEITGQKREKRLLGLFKTITPWIIIISFAIFLSLIILSSPLASLFGKEFLAGVLILMILGGGQLVNICVGSAGALLSMTGHSKVILWNTISVVSLNLILNYLLIPPLGMKGAAVATTISLIAINLLRLMEIKLILNIHPFSPRYGKALFSVFISGALIYGFHLFLPLTSQLIHCLILFILFCLIYPLSLFIFGFINPRSKGANLYNGKR